MSWKLDKNRPIAVQIGEILCARIAAGEYPPLSKLPSVRTIAVEAGVNPNTVQKAIEILVEKGVIDSVLGSGSYVKEDISPAKEMLRERISDKTRTYLEDMKMLGMNEKETYEYIGRLIK